MIVGIEAQRIFRNHKHGMDFVALEMIRSLQKIDKVNQYVIFVNDGPDRCLEETNNFKIVQFGASYPVWEQLKLPKEALKHGCEILHCTSNTAPINCPIPLVVTIHDIIYFETNPLTASGYSLYQRFGNLYRRLVVRKNLKEAKKIITVSHFERKRFEEYLNLPKGLLSVVYNGVGTHFKPTNDLVSLDSVKLKYNLPDKYILFLGNTDPKKNTANTIIAFARYTEENEADINLVVADLDPSRVKKILEDENLGQHFNKIHFTGYIANTDLPAVIQMASIFLYPSKRESFGIPILEAMGSGTPVITSNTASMPEVAGDAALLVDPLDIQSIADGIKRLMSDESLRSDLAEKGLRRVTDFSWDNTAKEVLGLYNHLIEN